MAHEHISKMMARHQKEKREMHTRHERETKDMHARHAEDMGAPAPGQDQLEAEEQQPAQ